MTPFSGKHALLVENNPDCIEQLTKYLQSYHCGYTVVRDTKEAMALICDKNFKYDILLSDIAVSGAMDGFDVIHKSRRCRSRTPIVVITGYADEEIIRKAIELGAKDYLVKPLPSSRLHNVMVSLIGKMIPVVTSCI